MTALELRKFEIELFWTRSQFFWLFNAAAFAGFALLAEKQAVGLSLLLASFGLVASCGWYLVNRGSKYWYENWELMIEDIEDGALGGDFFEPKGPKPAPPLVRGRRFSVSAVITLISLYVALLWAVALGLQVLVALTLMDGDWSGKQFLRIGAPALVAATIAFIAGMAWTSLASERAGRRPKDESGGRH